MGRSWPSVLTGILISTGTVGFAPAGADTLEWALVQAYQNNPALNAQRALVRAQDEAVPQALSGYRPRVSLTATVGNEYLSTLSKAVTPIGPVYRKPAIYSRVAIPTVSEPEKATTETRWNKLPGRTSFCGGAATVSRNNGSN
jgi:Outer membrane efflux protein